MTALTPYVWPQDSLQIPPGMGVMTQVESANALVTRREGKTFTADFDFTAVTTPRPIETRIIQTDQDGDFWCSNIYLAAFYNVAGALVSFQPTGRISIKDNRTGNSLTKNIGLPASYLFVNSDAPSIGTTPPPTGWRSTSTLIQPFCFTRRGGIQIDFAGLTNLATDTFIQIAFGGWQEYAHASR